MKSVFTFLIFVLVAFAGNAQKKQVWNKPNYDSHWYHFGFMLGVNTMDFLIHPSKIVLDPPPGAMEHVTKIVNNRQVGFNVAIVSNLKLGEFFDLRFSPGLAFGQRDLEYHTDTLVLNDQNELDVMKRSHVMKIESTFLTLPFAFKYRSVRINNYRPYLMAGFSPSFDLESQKKIKEEERPKIRLLRPDLYLEAGFGIDYYFPFFKLATEIKLSWGIADVIKRDETIYTQSIDRMSSKMVTIGFYFE